MCKNCSDISWHRLNLNQSKTNCPKNLNSDGLIVSEMGPWPECIFRSLLQFVVLNGTHVIRSRRNPRSRCAWLTVPELRCGYARTSFGIDTAAEVTISKCNLWKSWTLELASEFSHAHLTIFSTVWHTCWFYQDHASWRNAKLQKIYQYFVG